MRESGSSSCFKGMGNLPHSFFYSHKNDLAIAKIPKAASSTIRGWLPMGVFRDADLVTARQASRRVAFIRHPLDRLESCYSHFCKLRAMGRAYTSQKLTMSVVDEITSGWPQFVNYILSNEADNHWRPQSEFIADVPNILHRLDDLSMYYRNYWDEPPPPRRNSSARIPVGGYKINELLEYYADDIRLYNGI